MKTTLLRKVERFRLLAMLLVTVCAYGTANAQGATSDEINAAIVTKSDFAITWDNGTDYPWVLVDDPEDGVCLQAEDVDAYSETTSVSFTFTLNTPSRLLFDLRNDGESTADYSTIYIDGTVLLTNYYSNNWLTYQHMFEVGSHTVTIERRDVGGWDGPHHFARIRNVRIDEPTWDEVKLEEAGQLIEKVVDILGDRNVQDIEFLKITGSLNATDWEAIRRLKGILAIDMYETNITELPNQAFEWLTNLQNVTLPETLKIIGEEAFNHTACTSITIPASVEIIKNRAWKETPLTKITFAENSRLKKIEFDAFHSTPLIEFIMPDGVVEVEYAAFWECRRLQKMHISESLTRIPSQMCYGCENLKSINFTESVTEIEREAFYRIEVESIILPESLLIIGDGAFSNNKMTSIVIPKNVIEIGHRAFEYCRELKEVTLNSKVSNLDRTFLECDQIEKITIPTATPPSVSNDPFEDLDKTSVKVLVPDFAVASFKMDPYWFQYSHIQSSAEVSEGDYWAINGSLKLNPTSSFSGTPSVDVNSGAIFEIAANTTVAFNDFTYSNEENVPACFLNESDQVTANSLTAKFFVPESYRWYFFSPVTEVRMADVSYPTTDSWVIYRYNGNRRATENSSEGNWAKMTTDDTLKRGQGYIIQAALAGTLHLPAAASEHSAFFGLGEAPMTIADNAAESAENTGWNLVGNPYPAYYDIYSIVLQAPITVWDGSTYRAYSLTDDNYILRPMQPFFVQKSSSDITLAMPRSGRQGSNEVIRPHAQQVNAVDANRHKLNLEITRSDNECADDYTRIVINEEASLEYEGKCDASKFMSMDGNVTQIYSIGMNSHPLAINERPYADGNAALGVYIPEAGAEYRISASRADRKAWLRDAEMNIEQDLTEGDYIFTATRSGEDNRRFSIRFAPTSSNAVEGMAETDLKVTGMEGAINVTAPHGTYVAVYGVDGVLKANATVGDGSLVFAVAGGVYIVKANGQSFKTVVK